MHRVTLLPQDTNSLHWTYIVIVPIVTDDVTYIHMHVPITKGNRNGNITSDAHRATYPRPPWSSRIRGTWYSPREMFGNGKPSDVCTLTFLPFWEINYRNCLKGYYAAVLHPTQKLHRMPHVTWASYTQPCAHHSRSRTAILLPRFIGN
jgi:hypothetical protein